MPQQPRLGCGAAIVRDGQLLLVKRRRDPEADCWGLPGGKVDWLEPVEQAMRREILEELGLTLQGVSLLCVVDQIDPERQEHWVSPVYLASAPAMQPRNCEPQKHSAIAWFELDRLPKPLTLATRAAVRALVQMAAVEN
ncbi:NUDIX domain-containing protein [Pseudomonas sp. Fl5BN2]|uniref:NUDIX hydrolase n=1 Tax=unclassified Pseudomonas TaxID=196821 RepID=UPI001377E299|nr:MULTISPECIES: NUDIX domain-containing protein [unclassified Pseudomonas]NBF01949.1 NUDIX domain-containing protein [Pseudomonas sp. Fl5BN2]NBF08112.1 NUDIX domain-containing protein [Pseudomonas sp. Fl4BN1]